MNITYDTTADAVYVRMSTNAPTETVQVSDHLLIDADEFGNAVGVEVLEASSQGELVRSLQDSAAGGIPVRIESGLPSTM